MAIGTKWDFENVCRAQCSACGATGPMAKSAEAAQYLAVLCDWDPAAGRCASCAALRTKLRGAKKARKPRKKE